MTIVSQASNAASRIEWELALTPIEQHADVAQLVERELPKLEVAGSRPVVRFPIAEPKIRLIAL
jgi:hypothetical protein